MHYEKIDYYSFTIPTLSSFEGHSDDTCEYVKKAFISTIAHEAIGNRFEGDWAVENAKGFYHSRLRHEPTGVALSFGSVNRHIYVELSGRACDNFDAINRLEPLIQSTHDRCSRIDFAADFETETTPEQFSASRNLTRWKYAPSYPSASGTTIYVGSRKSERMARVYRYNKPHPRSHLLRVEAEYKGDAARKAASLLTTHDLATVLRDAHSVFGWTDVLWDYEVGTGKKIPFRAHSPANANSVRWLYGDVVTAMRRAIEEKIIDLDEWLNFLQEGHS